MKKYILTIVLILTGIQMNSCEDFLTLEPPTLLSSALAFDNLQGIEAGMNGAYSILHADWVERQWIFADCLANQVREVNTLNNSNYQDALAHQVYTDLFNTANYLWRLSYRALHLVNSAIVALPEIEESNDQIVAKKNLLMGEAICLRGILNFVLNRFWAQPQNGLSVPLLTAPISVEDKPARATIEEVKAQVLLDLEMAVQMLEGIDDNKDRINQWAAKAILARAYFEYEMYSEARDMANEVIENGPFALLQNEPKAPYSNVLTSENIFSFLSISQDRAAQNMYERYTAVGNPFMLGLEEAIWDQISTETADQRFKKLFLKLGNNFVCRKYDDNEMNLPYIRLAEIYLIRAESRARLDQLDAALADLNALRNRATLGNTSYNDKNDLLNKIYRDRLLEMAGEGDMLHTHKRLKMAVGGYPYEEAAYKLVFFMPEDEVLGNENLIQNDLW